MAKQEIETLRKRYDDAVEAIDLKDKELIQERAVSRDLRKRVGELQSQQDLATLPLLQSVVARAEQAEAQLAEAKEALRLSAQGLHTYVEALNAGNAALAAKDARIAELENKNSYNLQIVREATARIAELEEQRKELDRRIHNQRLANRDNWEIVEMRGNMMGSPASRAAYCRLLRWFREQRSRAERAEAERDALHLFSGAQAAVIKEMREALEPLAKLGKSIRPQSPDDDGIEIVVSCGNLRKARAALAPPPAGREG